MAASSPEPRAPPLLAARDLHVRVGDQSLLRGASFQLDPGELVVLLGASGTGKTVLLQLIAGILRAGRRGPRVSGSLHYRGRDLLRRGARRGRIGILFQDHALFDGLTALQNVRFAERHRRGPGPDGAKLLEELGVHPDATPSTMSGGQLQRLALARTLALAPDLVLYDEPTSGLDPANATRVAELLRHTHEGEARAGLVVTHDVATLAPIADRILLLDPATGRIEEVAAEGIADRLRALDPSVHRSTRPPAPSLGIRALERSADLVLGTLLALLHLIPTPPRARDGLRYLLHYLRTSSSLGAIAYFSIAGLIVGFVTTHFTFEHLPKRGFTEPLFVDEILRALGFLLYRVLCPVILTILIAARTGAAIASDVGNKSYARQIDALRSFGVAPSRYLLTASLWSTLLSTPIVFAISYLLARWVSLGVFIYGHPEETAFFWDRNFHRSLRVGEGPFWSGTWWLLLKLELCAFGSAAIAYFQGARPKASADDVSRAVTRTIIGASVLVLLVHFVLAFLEF